MKSVIQKGQKPKAFMSRAFKNAESRIVENFCQAIQEYIESQSEKGFPQRKGDQTVATTRDENMGSVSGGNGGDRLCFLWLRSRIKFVLIF